MTFVTGEKKQKSKGLERIFFNENLSFSDEIRQKTQRCTEYKVHRTASNHRNQSTGLYIEIPEHGIERFDCRC